MLEVPNLVELILEGHNNELLPMIQIQAKLWGPLLKAAGPLLKGGVY